MVLVFMLRILIFCFLFISFPNLVFASWEINELGRIPILEYHRIDQGSDQFGRTPKQFRDDLLWLYNNDYFLLPVSSFLNTVFVVPRGKKPFLLTFDDAHPTQFFIQENGAIDYDSAIGILNAFFKEHPDFGFGELFFVNPGLFGQPEFKRKKLEYLLETGRELGNHTSSHANVRGLPAHEIQKELGLLQGIVNEVLGRELALSVFAYPFGGVPKGEAELAVLRQGSYQDVSYSIEAAFLVGADPTFPPYHTKYEALYIPRIQAIDDEWKRWFGRVPGQTEKTASEVFYPFVSDGDPKIVSVRSKDKDMLNYQVLTKELSVCFIDDGNCAYEVTKSLSRSFPIENAVFRSDSAKIEKLSSGSTLNPSDAPISSRGNFLSVVFAAADTVYDLVSRFYPARFWQDTKSLFGLPRMKFSFNAIPSELQWNGETWTYVAQPGDSFNSIAEKFYDVTGYFLLNDFVAALSQANSSVQPEMEIIIPDVEQIAFDILPQHAYKRGIYWTGYTAGSTNGQKQADMLKFSDGNTIVFDVKEVEGMLFYDSKVPLAKEIGAISKRISNIRKLVKNLHNRGFYVIARQVLFKDHTLANARDKDFVIKTLVGGKPWANHEGLWWVDPSHPEVVQYNLDIVREVASFGVDEIQFDYIRFPALGGATEDVKYWYQDHPSDLKIREDVIVDFLRRAREVVADFDVALSADVFGVVAWNDGVDGKIVGQDIKRMAYYVDAIYPMIYPSHFGPDFASQPDPANQPYFFVQKSAEKFLVLVTGTNAEIRPWLQGFTLRVNNFGTSYIQKQVDALKDIGVLSYMIWNAGNKYDPAWPVF